MPLIVSVLTDHERLETASVALEDDKDFAYLVYVPMVYSNFCSL